MEILDRPAEDSPKTTVVRMKPQRTPIRWSNNGKEEFCNDYPAIGQFLVDLIRGEIKGFIRPRSIEEEDEEEKVE